MFFRVIRIFVESNHNTFVWLVYSLGNHLRLYASHGIPNCEYPHVAAIIAKTVCYRFCIRYDNLICSNCSGFVIIFSHMSLNYGGSLGTYVKYLMKLSSSLLYLGHQIITGGHRLLYGVLQLINLGYQLFCGGSPINNRRPPINNWGPPGIMLRLPVNNWWWLTDNN